MNSLYRLKPQLAYFGHYFFQLPLCRIRLSSRCSFPLSVFKSLPFTILLSDMEVGSHTCNRPMSMEHEMGFGIPGGLNITHL